MSDACTLAVRKHARAKGSARLVLLIYAFYADDDGRNAYPSPKTVAEETGLQPRRVYGIIDELEADGELVYTGRSPVGTRTYRVQPGAQANEALQPGAQADDELQPGAQADDELQPGAKRDAPEVQPGAIPDDDGLQPGAQAEPGLHSVAQFSGELVQPGAKTPPKLQPGALYSESVDDSLSNPPVENQSTEQTRARAHEGQAASKPAPRVGARTVSEFDYWHAFFKAEGFNEPGLTELARAAADQHVGTAQVDEYLNQVFGNEMLHDPHGYIVRNGARQGFKLNTGQRKSASAKPQTAEDEFAEIRRKYGPYLKESGFMTFEQER